ncbi:MAG TPA: winged helix DNA-binding domain-containing protein [Gaiella sp.]
MRRLGVSERRARLVRRHLLTPARRATDALEVARSLTALHSTDPVTVFVSLQARTDGVLPDDIERTLYDERTLVRVLCMRRTLFVVPRELVPAVFAACTDTIAARERRRLEQMVVDSGISTRPGAWLRRAEAAALAALDARGEAYTRELVSDVPQLARKLRVGAGTRFETTQSAGARVLPQLAMERRIVRGRPRAWKSGQYRWVPVERWLEDGIPALDADVARGQLLQAWLAAFGPATETDLRWWTGWTARDARAALASLPLATVDLDGTTGFLPADDLEPVEAPEPWAALLPTLDPTTMGWKERDWYLGPHGRMLFDSAGNAGPTVWWDGRVVGGWAQRADGEIVHRLLEDVGSEAERAIGAEAERLQAWVGDVRFKPGFLPPFQRELSR